MSEKTGIEWTDATWNPIRGCSRVSEGCRNCYAERQAARWREEGQPYHGFAHMVGKEPRWTGKVAAVPHVLTRPLTWQRPRRIFVNSMSDLFHENLPDEAIDYVFTVMALCPHHIFQVLTKRPERMRDYLAAPATRKRLAYAIMNATPDQRSLQHLQIWIGPDGAEVQKWPLTNVWLGVSVEDQKTADARIPHLLATPAAKRFISAEPLLGPIDLNRIHQEFDGGLGHSWESALNGKRFDIWSDGDLDGCPKLDWIIVGGESGPNARPMHPDWARSLRDQCQTAGVPFFFKQWGEWQAAPEIIDAGGQSFHQFGDGTWMQRHGKKRTGRLLDGRTWDEVPA